MNNVCDKPFSNKTIAQTTITLFIRMRASVAKPNIKLVWQRSVRFTTNFILTYLVEFHGER